MNRDIDLITARLRADIPGVDIQQLTILHPGDDDGLWSIQIPDHFGIVQLESSSGSCPFLIESDLNSERCNAYSVEEAVTTVKRLYGLA